MRDIYQALHQSDFTSYSEEALTHYIDHCAAASTAVRNALIVIGNLMFEASQNEDYSGEESKRDLFLVGSVLRFLPRLEQVLADNSDNATFEQARRQGKSK